MENVQKPNNKNACLILKSGEIFYGKGLGKPGISAGEICFNTAMTGYQEAISDPSYAGQIITFTFPHIGNTGVNDDDIESGSLKLKGVVLRNAITHDSNFRSNDSLDQWLCKKGIVGISDIDTRAITTIIREKGACNAVIFYPENNNISDLSLAYEALKIAPDMIGLDLAKSVSCSKDYHWKTTAWEFSKGCGEVVNPNLNIVSFDYGAKQNILRILASYNANVVVLPANSSFDEVMKYKPDGIFLSNGPGDPAETGKYAIDVLNKLINIGMPVFGICLGHQLLALALGAKTHKMHQGHRGANHPVKNLITGKVEITSQNHGFAVDASTIPYNVEVTHVSLFDNSIEGLKHKEKPVFSVQYHPESSPGPHDSRYLFDQFFELVTKYKESNA